MSSPKKHETCAQNTLCVIDDKKEDRVKLLQRAQWLRAAILGANDGLLSTTSLMLGVGAAVEEQWPMILSGLAGALAGAFSMAVGEFVSVSTQRDIEIAAFDKCGSKVKLSDKDDVVDNDIKLEISASRNYQTVVGTKIPEPGVKSPVSCIKSTSGDSLSSHTSKVTKSMALGENWATMTQSESEEEEEEREALPNPYKAAFASAASFLCGSLVPLVAAISVADELARIVAIVVVTSLSLALFGGIGAHLGGLPLRVSATRVLVGGWISMAITYSLLKPFDRDDHKGHHDND